MMQRVNSGSARQPQGDRMLAVPLASLRVDSVTEFALYVRPSQGGEWVLYRARSLPFEESVRRRLSESGHESVYIQAADEQV